MNWEHFIAASRIALGLVPGAGQLPERDEPAHGAEPERRRRGARGHRYHWEWEAEDDAD